MRTLLPVPGAGVDLDASYAWPAGGVCVRATMVASLDGSATASGRTQGLSSPADKRVFAWLRGTCDVILVGAGTARAERYAAVRPREAHAARRAAAGQGPTPAIAVVTRALDLDLGGGLFTGPARTMVLTCAAADPGRLAAAREVADVVLVGRERVDAARAVDALAERGHRRVLCEGGPTLLAAVAAAGRLDELCLTLSPLLVGGDGPRVLTGAVLAPPPGLALVSLLEAGGTLLTRYARPG